MGGDTNMTLDLSVVKFGNNGYEKNSTGCGNYRNFNWELEEMGF